MNVYQVGEFGVLLPVLAMSEWWRVIIVASS